MSFGPHPALLGTAAKPSSFKLINIPDECKGNACQDKMDFICKIVESAGGAF